MATWEVKIEPIDIPERIVSVSATRTDGTDVRTFAVTNAKIKTQAQKNAVAQNIKEQYTASLANDVVMTEISDLEASAKTYLEANA